MSLWRVKHTLSPVAEAAVVFLALAYGLFGIYVFSLRPFAVAALSPVGAVPEPVVLDIDAWTRHDVADAGYAFAAPPGWIVDASDPASVRFGRSAKELARAGLEGDGVLIETVPLHERREVQNLAAEEFAGARPALYDVAIDGRSALFAVEFSGGRIRRQVVYVPSDGAALIFRAARLDPAVFATFLSTVKFLTE